MAVLNTTSPTDRPVAPTETPSNTVPSSRTRIAVWVTGFAYVRLQKTAGAVLDRSGGVRYQASENDTGTGPLAPDETWAGTERFAPAHCNSRAPVGSQGPCRAGFRGAGTTPLAMQRPKARRAPDTGPDHDRRDGWRHAARRARRCRDWLHGEPVRYARPSPRTAPGVRRRCRPRAARRSAAARRRVPPPRPATALCPRARPS